MWFWNIERQVVEGLKKKALIFVFCWYKIFENVWGLLPLQWKEDPKVPSQLGWNIEEFLATLLTRPGGWTWTDWT